MPCRGSFGCILTMQLEPPKTQDGTTNNKIFGSMAHLHVLRGMGARLRQHGCNFMVEEVSETSTLTNTTPRLPPLPATWLQHAGCPH